MVVAIDRLAMEDPQAKTDPAVAMEGMNELLSWAPQTLRLELVRTTGVLVSWSAIGRLMACIAILSSDDFFKRPQRFVRLCNILSGDLYDPETWDPADSEECAWGIMEATLLTQTPLDEYSEEIRYYVGAVCVDEGLVQPPKILAEFAKFDDPNLNGLNEFTDDPDLYENMNYVQQEKAAEIQSTLDARLNDLMDQLNRLPLHNGSVQDMFKHFQS